MINRNMGNATRRNGERLAHISILKGVFYGDGIKEKD